MSMWNPSGVASLYNLGAPNAGAGATGGSSTSEQKQFVGLGGVRNVLFQEGLHQGESVVTAASTGNASGGQSQANPVYASTLDLPVPKEILEVVEALTSTIQYKKNMLKELKDVFDAGQAYENRFQNIQRDIARVKMDLHEMENEARRSAARLESMKADIEKKKQFVNDVGLSLDSNLLVKNPKLFEAACFDSAFDLMEDCRERLSMISKGITNAEQVYGYLQEPSVSVSDLVHALTATKDAVMRFSCEVQLISEACNRMSVDAYGRKFDPNQPQIKNKSTNIKLI